MNNYDVKSTSVDESLHQCFEQESPPFALNNSFSSLEGQRDGQLYDRNSYDNSRLEQSQPPTENSEIQSKHLENAPIFEKQTYVIPNCLEHSSNSKPPDLTESEMTDGTSRCSDATNPLNDSTKITSSQLHSHHIPTMSSIFSTTSLRSIPLEPQFPNPNPIPKDDGSFRKDSEAPTNPHTTIEQSGMDSCFSGFSALMKAADDSSINFEPSVSTISYSDQAPNHLSNERLAPLLENQDADSGVLISEASRSWMNVPLLDSTSRISNSELSRPLLNDRSMTTSIDDISEHLRASRVLPNDPFRQRNATFLLERARASIRTKIESDDSFEVSLLLEHDTQFSVNDVVDLISNIYLLDLWCDPVESLVVTSTSSGPSSRSRDYDETMTKDTCEGLSGSKNCIGNNERSREYEAEWIEATTSSLDSPSGGASFILGVGQRVLESLGCISYGKVRMFVERPYGRIGMTIGPFGMTGVFASHSISVSLEGSNTESKRIRIVNRVRLSNSDEEEGFPLSSMFGNLSRFLLPSIDGYVNQAAMSMARLRILLESNRGMRTSGQPCS